MMFKKVETETFFNSEARNEKRAKQREQNKIKYAKKEYKDKVFYSALYLMVHKGLMPSLAIETVEQLLERVGINEQFLIDTQSDYEF